MIVIDMADICVKCSNSAVACFLQTQLSEDICVAAIENELRIHAPDKDAVLNNVRTKVKAIIKALQESKLSLNPSSPVLQCT